MDVSHYCPVFIFWCISSYRRTANISTLSQSMLVNGRIGVFRKEIMIKCYACGFICSLRDNSTSSSWRLTGAICGLILNGSHQTDVMLSNWWNLWTTSSWSPDDTSAYCVRSTGWLALVLPSRVLKWGQALSLSCCFQSSSLFLDVY